jgi:hypothetical protein
VPAQFCLVEVGCVPGSLLEDRGVEVGCVPGSLLEDPGVGAVGGALALQSMISCARNKPLVYVFLFV